MLVLARRLTNSSILSFQSMFIALQAHNSQLLEQCMQTSVKPI